MPQATSLAAVIESEFGSAPELIEAAGGKFEVVADGELVFSKLEENRFPEDAEVISKLNELAANR